MRPTGTVIFGTPVDAFNGAPFFRGASDLAKFLAEKRILTDTRARDRKSLGTYLSQVLIYEDPRRSRPLSPPLQEQVGQAIRIKLREADVGPDVEEEWSRRFRLAVELDAVDRAVPSPLNADHLFYEVLEKAQTADEQFIVTSQPAELVPSSRARTLNEILLARLELDRLPEQDPAPKSPAKYTFNFPSENVGFRFWRSLARAVERQPQPDGTPIKKEAIKRAFESLVAGGHLVVQEVPAYMCSCPTVVFEPEGNRAVGFNLYYHSERDDRPLVSLAKMDRNSLEFWRNNFFTAIARRMVEVKAIEIPTL